MRDDDVVAVARDFMERGGDAVVDDDDDRYVHPPRLERPCGPSLEHDRYIR
jgi:hypothetical protein